MRHFEAQFSAVCGTETLTRRGPRNNAEPGKGILSSQFYKIRVMNMNRKEFLKGAGLLGLWLAMPGAKVSAKAKSTGDVISEDGCVLIPSETAGPFPLDLTENTTYFRQDIREGQPGALLNLKLRIIGDDNCAPMSNVRVNIWHCTNEGIYSGYNTNNNPGDANSTHLRGYQMTDSNGEVEFTTIFPGWYNGRICHIHFQVAVSSSYSAVSQLTFNIEEKNALYAANTSLYPKGADPLSFNGDNIFADGVDQQIATLTPNSETGGYDSFMEVTVRGSGTVGVGHIERETAKVFELGQNFPNPYVNSTTVPFTIKQLADVSLELWDLSGRRLATMLNNRLSAGEYSAGIDPAALGLPRGTYVYQLTARTNEGVYRLPKVMTYNG